ncbi:MAG: signal peptidase II [Pseudomonadota bacterium]
MSDNNKAADAVALDTNARLHVRAGLAVAFLTLVLDQAIKKAVEAYLPFGQPVEVLPFFSLLYTFNTGIAFSFLNTLNPTTLLVIAGVVMMILMYLWWHARSDGLLVSLGYGMIMGGALGNIIDRALYGHVVDYVFLHAGSYSFAIFNLADAALTVGVGLILLATFFGQSSSRAGSRS